MADQMTAGDRVNAKNARTYHADETVTHLRGHQMFGLKLFLRQGEQVLMVGTCPEDRNMAARVNKIDIRMGLLFLVLGCYDSVDRLTRPFGIYWKRDQNGLTPVRSLTELAKADPKLIIHNSIHDPDWLTIGCLEHQIVAGRWNGWQRVHNGRLDDGSWPCWNQLTGQLGDLRVSWIHAKLDGQERQDAEVRRRLEDWAATKKAASDYVKKA